MVWVGKGWKRTGKRGRRRLAGMGDTIPRVAGQYRKSNLRKSGCFFTALVSSSKGNGAEGINPLQYTPMVSANRVTGNWSRAGLTSLASPNKRVVSLLSSPVPAHSLSRMTAEKAPPQLGVAAVLYYRHQRARTGAFPTGRRSVYTRALRPERRSRK